MIKGLTCLKKFECFLILLQFDRYKHTKHPKELKNLKQSQLEELLIASIDQFGLVLENPIMAIKIKYFEENCTLT